MRLLKLAHQYKEFAADVTLILQSYFTMPLPAETGFIEYKGWVTGTKNLQETLH
jgi:hypothetical protein